MRCIKPFILLLLLIVITAGVMAQDADMPVTPRCIDTTQKAVPLADVEFDGMVFISSEDGVRVLRNPLPTPYVIAFTDHYKHFGAYGSFSPDWKWFVYPSGTSTYANMVSRSYDFKLFNFIDPYTGIRVFSIPVERMDWEFSMAQSSAQGGYSNKPDPYNRWLSDTEYVIDRVTIADVETMSIKESPREISPRMLERWQNNNNDEFPDFMMTREFTQKTHLGDGTGYYTRFKYVLRSEARVYNLDGSLRFSFDVDPLYADPFLSPSGEWLYYRFSSLEGRNRTYDFRLVDTESGEIFSLCASWGEIVFSPDETQAMFWIQDTRQLWLLDLQTWAATQIDVTMPQEFAIVGWTNPER